MKYHRLSNEDLEELRGEFVTFLAAQSIVAAQWEQMKTTDPDQVDRLLDQFSDMIIQSALENTSVLRMVSDDALFVFRFDKEEAQVIHLQIGQGVPHRFSDRETMEALSSGTLTLSALEPQLETGKKVLKGDREAEMYLLMQQGAQPCPATFFSDMEKLISRSKIY